MVSAAEARQLAAEKFAMDNFGPAGVQLLKSGQYTQHQLFAQTVPILREFVAGDEDPGDDWPVDMASKIAARLVDMVEGIINKRVDSTAQGIAEGIVDSLVAAIAEGIVNSRIPPIVEGLVESRVEAIVEDALKKTVRGLTC